MRFGPIFPQLAILALLAVTGPQAARAQAGLGMELIRNCGTELKTYCDDVTVGGGRKVACLYAYNDRLTVRCALTLHKATVHAERAMAAMRNVVSQCLGDVDRFCAGIIPGKGRIALCLLANKPSLSRGCRRAISPLGPNP